MTATTFLIIIGVVFLLIILCAAFDLFFSESKHLRSVPHTPKPAILFPPTYTPQAVKTIAVCKDNNTGIVTVELRLTNGQLVILTTFDSDDAAYNRLCAEELVEKLNERI